MKLKDIITTINVQSQIIDSGSKLEYSKKKNLKSFEKLQSKEGGFKEKLEDKKLELASIGEKNKEVLYNDKGEYLFSKENTKIVNDYLKELMNFEEEFSFYLVDYSVLTDDEKDRISSIDTEEYEILSRFINSIPIELIK